MSRTRKFDPNHEPADLEDFDHSIRRAPMQDDAWGDDFETVEDEADLDLVDFIERQAHQARRPR